MLVAVIGEAYSEKWEKKELYAKQSNVNIFGDYVEFLSTTLPHYKYLYIISPKEEKDDLEDKIKVMKEEIQNSAIERQEEV